MLALALGATVAGAQVLHETGVHGTVVDRVSGAPVPGVEVLVLGRGLGQLADADGHFRLVGLTAGSYLLQVRGEGYVVMTWELAVPDDTMFTYTFPLEPQGVTLPAVEVEGESPPNVSVWLRGFEDRRGRVRGEFVTRADITRRNAATLGDLLRTVHGLRMRCGRTGCGIEMTRALGCRPTYFIDGVPINAGTAEGTPVIDIYGVEVYNINDVPVDFQRTQLKCGVIGIWTRRGPAR
jgi:hypothetical protein